MSESSKGMRQEIALARALLHDPTILLLDEPTSGLDPEITRSVRRLLDERRAAGGAILVSTHDLDEAERLADRVAVLQSRLLPVDRPATLRRRLTAGRVIIRVRGHVRAFVDTARAFDARAAAEDPTLVLRLEQADRDTPELVRALIQAGAEIVEVRPKLPALEDVYLRLVPEAQESSEARS